MSVFRRPRTEILTPILVPKPKNNPSPEHSTSQRSPPQLQNCLIFLIFNLKAYKRKRKREGRKEKRQERKGKERGRGRREAAVPRR